VTRTLFKLKVSYFLLRAVRSPKKQPIKTGIRKGGQMVANLTSSDLRIFFNPVALLAVTAFRFTEVVAKYLEKDNFIRIKFKTIYF
jgi:hypothetical protein